MSSFEEKLKEICDLLRIEPLYPAEIDITKIVADTVLKAIGGDDEQIHGKYMDDFKYPTAKTRNKLRAEIKAKVFEELGLKIE